MTRTGADVKDRIKIEMSMWVFCFLALMCASVGMIVATVVFGLK